MTDTLADRSLPDPLADQPEHHAVRSGPRRPRYGTHIFLIVMAIVWLVPAAVDALHLVAPEGGRRQVRAVQRRPHADLQQLLDAWSQGGFSTALTNSAIIVIPTVLI